MNELNLQNPKFLEKLEFVHVTRFGSIRTRFFVPAEDYLCYRPMTVAVDLFTKNNILDSYQMWFDSFSPLKKKIGVFTFKEIKQVTHPEINLKLLDTNE